MLQLLLKYFSDAPLSSKEKGENFFFLGGGRGGGGLIRSALTRSTLTYSTCPTALIRLLGLPGCPRRAAR